MSGTIGGRQQTERQRSDPNGPVPKARFLFGIPMIEAGHGTGGLSSLGPTARLKY
jgi:hypothetical protein